MTRGWEKIQDWAGPRQEEDEQLPENLEVIKPLMWPWIKHGADRWLNRKLLVQQLNKVLERYEGPTVAVTTIPLVADLVGELAVDRWVYYCVDDFGQWPGLEQQTLTTLEEKLIDRVDTVIAAGTHLQERLSKFRPDVQLLQHGLDLEHWSAPSGTRDSQLSALEKSPKPRVTFWGLIDRRLDLDWLKTLSQSLASGSIHLVGPQNDPDPELKNIPGLHFHPPVAYDDLPAVAEMSDVLMMPYRDAAVTRAMQPLKLLEYLATGLPVVVRDLPANREWSDCLDLADSADQFCELVQQRQQSGTPMSQSTARERLRHESWSHKAEQFREFIEITSEECSP
ncbi:MAG: glycosyltransferase [Planctomycetaceae bacterium]|nr:glycosyltransferase [Planctomycetaceae bacterium]